MGKLSLLLIGLAGCIWVPTQDYENAYGEGSVDYSRSCPDVDTYSPSFDTEDPEADWHAAPAAADVSAFEVHFTGPLPNPGNTNIGIHGPQDQDALAGDIERRIDRLVFYPDAPLDDWLEYTAYVNWDCAANLAENDRSAALFFRTSGQCTTVVDTDPAPNAIQIPPVNNRFYASFDASDAPPPAGPTFTVSGDNLEDPLELEVSPINDYEYEAFLNSTDHILPGFYYTNIGWYCGDHYAQHEVMWEVQDQ